MSNNKLLGYEKTHIREDMWYLQKINLCSDKGEVYIVVCGNEEYNLPHFHIISVDGNFHTCIRLDKAEYYYSKDHITNPLTLDELKILNKAMHEKSTNESDTTKSLWHDCVFIWNPYNPNHSRTIKTNIIPNYSNMVEYRIVHCNENEIIVDTIELPKLGTFNVVIYHNECVQPHFHLISADGKYNTPISLEYAKYFSHGKYLREFNLKQRNELDKYLSVNWKRLCSIWNDNNQEYPITSKHKPNYKDMKGRIHYKFN